MGNPPTPGAPRDVIPSSVPTRRDERPAATGGARPHTLARTAATVRVGILNDTHEVVRHALDDDGSLWFVPRADSREHVFAAAPSLPAQVLTATVYDVSSLPLPDRVRGTLTLTGPVRPAGRAPGHGPPAERGDRAGAPARAHRGGASLAVAERGSPSSRPPRAPARPPRRSTLS